MQIEFEIDQQRLTRTSDAYLIEGTKNFVECVFSFSSDWEELDKWALFKRDNKTYEILIEDNKCLVPTQCTASEGEFTISVVGRKNSENVTSTASAKLLTVRDSEFVSGMSVEGRLTNTYLVEVLAEVKELQGKTTESEASAAQSASNSANSARAASVSEQNAAQSATNASNFATNSARSATLAAVSEQNAATSLTEAQKQAQNALNSANSAKNWATGENPGGDYYSAKEYAEKAGVSAGAAATSEKNAKASETAAAASKNSAAASASAAAASAEAAQSAVDDALLARLGLSAENGKICVTYEREEQ